MAQRRPVESCSRKELLDTLSLVKPAVGRGLFVPVLSHVCFTGDRVLAYDDTIAIAIKHALPVECAVPADLFGRLVNSFRDEELDLKLEDNALRVRCGKTTATVPALPPDAFIFKEAFGTLRAEIDVQEELVKGIERCLVSVGIDPTHPAQMGVTMQGGDEAVLYSTDNVTMSRCVLEEVDLPDMPIILPTPFCRELLSLYARGAKHEPVLQVYDHCVVVRFGTWGMLYGKMITNEAPLDFGGVFERMMPKGKAAKAVDIPDVWEDVFSRACAVVDPKHPVTKLQATDGVLSVYTKSPTGVVDDDLPVIKGLPDTRPFFIDPQHVARASKLGKKFACYPTAFVLQDGDFTHLISHCEE